MYDVVVITGSGGACDRNQGRGKVGWGVILGRARLWSVGRGYNKMRL